MPTQNSSDLRVVVGGNTITSVGEKIGTAYTAVSGDPKGSIVGKMIDLGLDLLGKNLVADIDKRSLHIEAKSQEKED